MLFYLLFFLWEKKRENVVFSLVWVVYTGIYKIDCNIYVEKYLLAENVLIE